MRVASTWLCPVGFLLVCLVVGCLPGPAPPAAGDDDATAETVEPVIFESVEISPGQTRDVTLNQTQVILATQAGEERAVPIVLRHSVCSYSVDFTWRGTAYHREGEVQAYQLRSLDPAVAYEWAMVYHGEPLEQVKLFAHGPNRNFLAWVRGPSVLFVEVSTPRDLRTALIARYSRQADSDAPIYQVLPRDVVGARPFGVDAVKSDLYLDSLDMSDAGEFVLTVHGTDPGTVFTLVSPDGTTWRRQ